jgi:hypothetical protein
MNSDQIKAITGDTEYKLMDLLEEMENDFNRYPPPFELNPHREAGAFYHRHGRLKKIAERFIQFKNYQNAKRNNR